MAENGADLTPRQLKTIPHLLAAKDVRHASELSGISERTLWRWLSDPHFVMHVANHEHQMIDAAVRRLITLQDAAIDTLADVLNDPTVNAATRTRAALGVLEQLVKLRELRNTEARITALESVILARDSNNS